MPTGVYKRTKAHKRHISESLKGRKRSPLSKEWKRKLSEAGKRRRLSDEHKRKIGIATSKRCKGKKLNEITKKKISAALKGREPWNKGKECSEETKKKISIANKGKKHPHSEETKRKLSKALKGNKNCLGLPKSEEHRRKLSEARKGCKPTKGFQDRKHTEETKKQISTSLKGGRRTDETKLKMSKSAKEQWKDPNYRHNVVSSVMKAMQHKPNKFEIDLLDIIESILPNEYKYVGDGQFILGGKCPDFLNINGKKKLIEAYGDYWHEGQNPQDRIDYFKQFGYDCLVIWQHEMKDLEELKRKINDFVRKEQYVNKTEYLFCNEIIVDN